MSVKFLRCMNAPGAVGRVVLHIGGWVAVFSARLLSGCGSEYLTSSATRLGFSFVVQTTGVDCNQYRLVGNCPLVILMLIHLSNSFHQK